MPRSVETTSGVVHVIFKCADCDWRTEDYIGGQQKAQVHVLKTGHTVTGELGVAVEMKPGT